MTKFFDNLVNALLLTLWQNWLLTYIHMHQAMSVLKRTNMAASDTDKSCWYIHGILQYLQHMHNFLNKLMVLVHMMASLQAPVPKLLAVQQCNTELLWNFFTIKDNMMLLLMYYK